MTADAEDRSYVEATGRALGASLAGMMAGMVDGGMTREEALEIVKDYAWALASRPTETEGDDE